MPSTLTYKCFNRWFLSSCDAELKQETLGIYPGLLGWHPSTLTTVLQEERQEFGLEIPLKNITSDKKLIFQSYYIIYLKKIIIIFNLITSVQKIFQMFVMLDLVFCLGSLGIKL